MAVRSRVGLLCRRLWTEVRGVTSLEYAVIGGVIVITIAAAMAGVGPRLQNEYARVNDAVPVPP